VIAAIAAGPALAQKQGGVLRLSHFDSPASMSIREEVTRATLLALVVRDARARRLSRIVEGFRVGVSVG
jgi:hypothetical protein